MRDYAAAPIRKAAEIPANAQVNPLLAKAA